MTADGQPLHVWVTIGDEPGHIQARVCEECGCLVADEATHLAWHHETSGRDRPARKRG